MAYEVIVEEKYNGIVVETTVLQCRDFSMAQNLFLLTIQDLEWNGFKQEFKKHNDGYTVLFKKGFLLWKRIVAIRLVMVEDGIEEEIYYDETI